MLYNTIVFSVVVRNCALRSVFSGALLSENQSAFVRMGTQRTSPCRRNQCGSEIQFDDLSIGGNKLKDLTCSERLSAGRVVSRTPGLTVKG